MVERGVLWLLRHRRPPLDLTGMVSAFQPGVDALATGMAEHVPGVMGASLHRTVAARVDAGVPPELAQRSATWPLLHTAFDIVEIASARGRTPLETASIYWGLFEALDVAWLWERIGLLPRADRWQSHARAAQRDDLLACLRDLTGEAMRAGDMFTPPDEIVRAWARANERTVRRVLDVFAEIRTGGTFNLTTLSVALRQLRNVELATAVA
jgi:glutamate dehydrogenase